MGMERHNDVTEEEDENYEDEENSKIDGEVDLEGELINDLKELRKLRNKNQPLKEKMQEYEEEDRNPKEKISNNIKNSENILLI